MVHAIFVVVVVSVSFVFVAVPYAAADFGDSSSATNVVEEMGTPENLLQTPLYLGAQAFQDQRQT